MNSISNPSPMRFGRIHVLSRQVNEAFAEAYRDKSIPSALPQDARIRIHNGEDVFSALMGDDKSPKFAYYNLGDGRGIILTNKDTADLKDFGTQLRAEKAQQLKPRKTDFLTRFLAVKSLTQQIQWLWSRNDPDKP